MHSADAPVVEWLLSGPAWVQYRVRLDLLGQSEDVAEVRQARKAMLADPQVRELVCNLADWPGPVLTSHKSAGHHVHRLEFLTDLGLRTGDPGMNTLIKRIIKLQSVQGPFQVLMNIPKHFGGTGRDQPAWALCDAPVLVYCLTAFGLGSDRRVCRARDHLTELVRANGWPCAVSPELGRFRGPGRKDDPCPYANLVMLKALAADPGHRDCPAVRTGAETLLGLWHDSHQKHPYMFFMGTDFRKLKVPLVWYDIVHVLDVLTRLPWLHGDPRLRDMARVVADKADRAGRFTPESVWQAWAGWEFGQKKEPSRWLTLLCLRALQRLDGRMDRVGCKKGGRLSSAGVCGCRK